MLTFPKQSELMRPLTEIETAELDDFLMSDAISDDTMMLSALDGYMTALVIGPETVPLSDWLPGVWGEQRSGGLAFESNAKASRVLGLMLRHMNGIVAYFEAEPDGFAPMFDEVVYEEGGREYLDGEMWAVGFMQGVALREEAWAPLFEDAQAQAWWRPLYLLGAPEISEEEEALVGSPELREALAQQIATSLAKIYRYWMPHRLAAAEQRGAASVRREGPKVGRNDPCPCGSGKKFKKCCGAAALEH